MKNLWLAFLFFSTVVASQTRFNHQFDLPYQFNTFTSVLPTDSCYYVTGIISDTTGGFYKLGNIFLKFDLEGVIEFEKTFIMEDAWVEAWRGNLIPDGNGGFFDIADMTDTVRSAALLRYNGEGEMVELQSYLNPLFPDDNFIVAAELERNEDGEMLMLCGFDNDPASVDADILLMRLSPEGDMLDAHLFGSPNVTEEPYSLLIDGDGGIIIGSSKSNTQFVNQNYNSRSHVFKVDTMGEIEWEYLSPPNLLQDIATDMIMTSDGGIVVASGKGIEHVVNSSFSQLIWFPYIFKLTANNEFHWGTELRGTRQSLSTLVKIVAAPDESGYVGIGRIGEDVSIGEEVWGSWVVKVSPVGDSLWARYYSFLDDIKSSPSPLDLKNTPDGGYIIVGETRPEMPPQAQRAWIMKLDEHGCLIPGCEEGDTVLSSNDLPIETKLQLAIYPNPTSDFLNFQLRTPQQVQAATFRIVDAQGKVVKEINSNGAKDTHIVPVSEWAAGVYFLQYLEEGEVRASERFVVLE